MLRSFAFAALLAVGLFSRAGMAFELQPFKTIQLASFPNISVPLYKSSGTKGPAVLLVHGNSSSSRSYINQIVSLFGHTHKLFLLDLPGYGKGGKVDPALPFPVDVSGIPQGFPEYQVGLVEAIILAANDPAVQAKAIVGWSLGGDLTLLAQGTGALPGVKGLMMFGTAPVGSLSPAGVAPFLPPNLPGVPFTLGILPSFGFAFRFNAASPIGFDLLGKFSDPVPAYAPAPLSNSPNIGDAYTRAFFNNFRRVNLAVPAFFTEDAMIRADSRVRGSIGAIALGLVPPGPVPLPDETVVLQNLKNNPADPSDDVKLAVVHGEEDAFVNLAYLEALKANGIMPTLWKNKIHKVENTGHAVHWESPVRFNLILSQFLKDL